MFAFASFLIILASCSPFVECARLLPSPLGADTGQGRWGEWQMCKEGSYLLGMYTASTSGDPTTGNGPLGITQLKLMCGQADGAQFRAVFKNLTSGPDQYHQSNPRAAASLPQIKYCKQYANGFNLKNLRGNDSEKHPAVDGNSLGFRLHCGVGPPAHLDGGIDDIGSYKLPAGTLCTTGEYLCGVRIKTTFVQGVILVTNVDGQCCSDVAVSKVCTPSEGWITVYERDNRDSGSPLSIQFTTKSFPRWAIVEDDSYSYDQQRRSIPITGTTAFIYNFIDPLLPRFAKELGQHGEFGYDWAKLTSRTHWMEERVNSYTTTVDPYTLFRMEQLVGRCGVVERLADSFRMSSEPKSRLGGHAFYLGIIGGIVILFVGVVGAVVYIWKRDEKALRQRLMTEGGQGGNANERKAFIPTLETALTIPRY